MTLQDTETKVQGWFTGRVAHTKEWIGKNWPHFVTWLALGWSTVKGLVSHL